ncbi:hypothetical protein XA68_12950 [Ophiocordyceps unilateralis]|uniref:KOW domain-containing protein n=1 Tax=Ophiocordyceps unilateralis TaxID=268505 RepID=A0A2A9PCI5_OPHUN|nr:hypothetical protein XA68_12950 [Ophiocordyceps unilateralis]
MQKLLRRTAHAERQAARRLKEKAKLQARSARAQDRPQFFNALREITKDDKAARRARIEDWELGPLAPKRDLGCNDYGVSWEHFRLNHPDPDPEVVKRRCAWAGGPHLLNLAVGDRVLIMEGPDKGKIDRIKEIMHSSGTVRLERRHQAVRGNLMERAPTASSLPISIGSIRLVYPLRHPESGHIRDVVINQLKSIPPNMKSENMSLDRWEYGNKWDRLVPSLSVVIPWPKVEAPEYEDIEGDTFRDQVEERTFFFSLKSPPMPPSVLDELRNRYSKFRTRHEPWYIERKEAEQAAKKAKTAKDIKSMMTPMDELHEMRMEKRRAWGEPQLTDDMLERIGRIMARNKAAMEKAASTSDPPVAPVAGSPVASPSATGPP